MNRLRWPLLIVLICLPLALVVYGAHIPGLSRTEYAMARAVPEGDQELAWLNITTGGANWERFVAGVRRAANHVPGMSVDDSGAFLDRTTSVPEVVIERAGHSGKLRIRWYKVGSDHPPATWLKLLAQRSPAPLAVIGGGSSDRARDLAWALARQTNWQGERPLFFITTATAEKVHTGPDDADNHDDNIGQTNELLRIYESRSFRFCFNNRQMAEAILNFIWQSPTLRPRLLSDDAKLAVSTSALAAATPTSKPTAFYVDWDDDPYSGDLIGQFRDIFYSEAGPKPTPNFSGWRVPFSVGGYYNPNRSEEEVAENLLKDLNQLPSQRSLLIVPTAAAPARRFLRTLSGAAPGIGRKLVAINGDGMGVNTILRDGEFAWPVRVMNIPMVLFTHNNPVGWDEATNYDGTFKLIPPNSTEDVLHFADMVASFTQAAYCEGESKSLTSSSEEFAKQLRNTPPVVFDSTGNRVGGRGEHVCVVMPRTETEEANGLPDATFQVWRRTPERGWLLVRSRVLNPNNTEMGN
jgi:hypothetical protein